VIAGFALMTVLLLARTGVDLWAKRRVNSQVTALEAQHGSLDVSTLRVPDVPEANNRARAMRAAIALLVGDNGVQESVARFQAAGAPAPVPADLQAFVENNRAALKVAAEARSRPQSNWEVDYSTGSNAPEFLQIRRLSTALYLAFRMDLDAGRTDEAARWLATGLALSASLRQEPSLLTQLIRSAVALQQFRGVQRLLTESDPSMPALEELARLLAENRTPAPMHLALLGELKTFHDSMRRSVAGEGGLWPGQIPWLRRPLFRVAHARYLGQFSRLLNEELGPRPRPEVSSQDPPNLSLIPGGVAMAVRGVERAMDTGDLHTSALSIAELAVALRRYQLASSEYPATLEALTPTYLATIPSDPLTGTLPTYTQQTGGFTLQSDHRKDLARDSAELLTWTVRR
jgi:hypothetical protein